MRLTCLRRPRSDPANQASRPPVTQAPTPDVAPQAKIPVLDAGTTLQVQLPRSAPMKAGTPLQANLLYPVFLDGKIILPKGTQVRGASHRPRSRSQRASACTLPWRLHALSPAAGALRPGHIAQWSESALRRTRRQQRRAGPRAVVPRSPTSQVHLRERLEPGEEPTLEQVAFFTEPGFGDRALQLLYHQLPYHPERIVAHTAWTFELAQPLTLPDTSNGTLEAQSSQNPTPSPPAGPEVWSVNALLKNPVSSATSKVGEPVTALVVEPVYDRQHELVVPQGSLLIGRVSIAKPAQSLGQKRQAPLLLPADPIPPGSRSIG